MDANFCKQMLSIELLPAVLCVSVTNHSSPLASSDDSNHGNLPHRFSTSPRAQTMATVISSAVRLRASRPSRGACDLIARAASSSANPGDGGESGDEGACVVVFRGKVIRAKRGQRLRTALLLGGESPHNGGANAINCRARCCRPNNVVNTTHDVQRPPRHAI